MNNITVGAGSRLDRSAAILRTLEGIGDIGRLIGRHKRLLGGIGEALIVKHLTQRGFVHVESNYRKKVGEIDVVMRKDETIHFIEVKTVSRENIRERLRHVNHETPVSRETGNRKVYTQRSVNSVKLAKNGKFTPEQNVSPQKMRRMSRVIQIYLEEKGIQDKKWQFDVASVYLDHKNMVACIRRIENVPVEA
jgi:Holliday junction resolvase-like predicted endonuclease